MTAESSASRIYHLSVTMGCACVITIVDVVRLTLLSLGFWVLWFFRSGVHTEIMWDIRGIGNGLVSFVFWFFVSVSTTHNVSLGK
jgi:hypothetical protein